MARERGVLPSPYARAPLRRARGIALDEFRFLKGAVTTGLPKVTIPAPDVMHFFLGPRSVDPEVYPDLEQYYADLVAVYRAEVRDLVGLGCTALQLDDTALPCNCDDRVRAEVRARGEDPDALTLRYVGLINDALAACPPGVVRSVHMCRGNLKGAWMAQGGYEPIAEAVFGSLAVDAFLLEFDSPRAGDFRALRFVPAPKRVVLGLVSTKTPTLESADGLKRRIDEAARYVPLERIGLSPQCGFSSAPGSGQPITPDDQRRKLELVLAVARDVWGTD
jgi:5-methyltetrahydropteroyltriglutamate--homocysteine methyltransferase